MGEIWQKGVERCSVAIVKWRCVVLWTMGMVGRLSCYRVGRQVWTMSGGEGGSEQRVDRGVGEREGGGVTGAVNGHKGLREGKAVAGWRGRGRVKREGEGKVGEGQANVRGVGQNGARVRVSAAGVVTRRDEI
ncbi:hypothetical protein A6V37_37905 [Paraburkholderia ginsengiterrae]|uniref:Uncharacterized protein n=1 Tax=Paraburkholderia ginsengiterrae TaxID=1462993 RepID=A0A1A9ND91_9BURK|nr:hypothetical protein A6V37_37905 [Paraburkholderia ginsengiterrae]